MEKIKEKGDFLNAKLYYLPKMECDTTEMVLKNEGDCLSITAGSSKYNVYLYY